MIIQLITKLINCSSNSKLLHNSLTCIVSHDLIVNLKLFYAIYIYSKLPSTHYQTPIQTTYKPPINHLPNNHPNSYQTTIKSPSNPIKQPTNRHPKPHKTPHNQARGLFTLILWFIRLLHHLTAN